MTKKTAHSKISDASDILRSIGMPAKQQNLRSALTLLALAGLRPDDPWNETKRPMLGITPMMEFFSKHYGKKYKPNSRETVRRQTVHQFLQAGLIAENPDKPNRPTNSGQTVYQLTPDAATLLTTYDTTDWVAHLKKYLSDHQPLEEVYAGRKKAGGIPLQLPSGETLRLSHGLHSTLTKRICDEFAYRFAPGGMLLYIGDTADKFAYVNETGLKKLGIKLDPHGKIPDVIIHHVEKNWLFLIEAVTSHGPVSAKRRKELHRLFAHAKADLVYVTAFKDIASMKKHASDISWETEVWLADSPDHMIHFDGEKFLALD